MTTTDTVRSDQLLGVPHLRKDLGVAIVVVTALLLGWLLREATVNRTIAYQDSETGFSLQFPVAWGVADSLQDVMLKVENPTTGFGLQDQPRRRGARSRSAESAHTTGVRRSARVAEGQPDKLSLPQRERGYR